MKNTLYLASLDNKIEGFSVTSEASGGKSEVLAARCALLVDVVSQGRERRQTFGNGSRVWLLVSCECVSTHPIYCSNTNRIAQDCMLV